MDRFASVQFDVLDFLEPFAAGLGTFLALDLVWIGLIGNQYYTLRLTAIDMGWGFVLSAATATVMAWVSGVR